MDPILEYLDNFYWTLSKNIAIRSQLISSYCITLRHLKCVIASGMFDSKTFFLSRETLLY